MMSTEKLDIPTPYRIKRYYFYLLLTIFSVGIPWVTIDGNHFFLLSFDHKELHLFFISFSMQELYLMPFLLMMLFIGVFGITAFGGRMFCGWGCPQTIFRVVYRDFIETKLLKLRKRIKNKQQEPDYSKPINKLKKAVALLLWTVLAFLAAADFMWFFIPPEDFFAYIQNPSEHMFTVGMLVTVALFLIYDVIILKENFCVYVCPYSRIQSVLYDDDTIMAIYDETRGGKIYNEHKEKIVTKQDQLAEFNECTTCESCVTVCPTHIDIREGLQLECINCLECVDACTTVMGNLGKPSLVEWSSIRETEKKAGKTEYLRPKILGYIGVLVLLTILLVIMGSKKEYMQLNINKESRLFKLEKGVDGKKHIDNIYTFLFENTQEAKHKYYFEVVKHVKDENGKELIVKDEHFKIIRPTEPFKIRAHKTYKIPVVIRATDLRTKDDGSSLSLPITIRAFAVDAKEEIVIERKTIFVYPSKAKYEAFKDN